VTRLQQPDLVIRAHNVHNGNGQPQKAASAFVDAMHELAAHIGVVTEAKSLVYPLRQLAQRQDLRLVAETPKGTPRPPAPVPEQGDTVLILRDIFARRSRTKVMTRAWIVRRYQRWHEPRRDQTVMLREVVRGVWGTHLPPGGPDDPINGPAWREQMGKALAWAARGGCRAVVGDVNCSRARLEAYIEAYSGPRRRRVRTAVVVGHGVDLCIVIGGTADGATLEHGGSDHRAQLYAITATGARAAMRRWIKKTLRKARRRR
jgi:hypothetical protein